MNIIVTTNVKTNEHLILEAKNLAEKFNTNYVERKKLTIKELLAKYGELLVVYSDKLVYFAKDGEQLFFHLDTAMIRIKNNNEQLIKIIGSNNSVLDMTMGLARDSIVLSYFDNEVTALESNKIIYKIVSKGLKNYESSSTKINNAMRNITTRNIDSYDYLKKCADNSYDVVYIDPMFNVKIKNSNNLMSLETLANKSVLTEQLFLEMKRVAKKKIVIKAHNKDKVFEKFGFKKLERVGAKFSYGYVDVRTC